MSTLSWKWKAGIRLILITLCLMLISWLIIRQHYIYIFLPLLFMAFQLYAIFKLMNRIHREVNDFAESIRYRDFSRSFHIETSPSELKALRRGFNEINTAFKTISRERETQYIYLQKILEIIDTGIISYETTSGDIGWMNEAFKNLTAVPYLK